MSDYTETFTKVTGNTVDAADFETEFDAIVTAVATKANKISSATANNVVEQDSNGDLVDTGLATPSSGFVGLTDSQTLTNKIITGANNTLTVRAADLTTTQFGGDYILLQEQQNSGTEGGASSSGWQTRVLNTEASDSGSICALSSNQFTLSAGTYRILASAPSYSSALHKLRLKNVSDTTYPLYGQNSWADSLEFDQTVAILVGEFTIATSKTLSLEHYMSGSAVTKGLGQAVTAGTEIYAQVELWRVK